MWHPAGVLAVGYEDPREPEPWHVLGGGDARAEGRSAERARAIERMLRKGKTPEEIHDLLEYSMEEIEQVEKELCATARD